MSAKVNEKVELRLVELLAELKQRVTKTREYIVREGKDPEGTYELGMVKGEGGGGVLYEG